MFRIVSILALGFLISTACLGQAGSTQVSPCEQSTPVDQNLSTKSDCTGDRVQIEFEGLHAFTKADVLKSFREEKVALAEGRVPSDANIDEATTVLKKLLQNKGYMDPTMYGTVVGNPRVVRFVIKEGPRYSFGLLSFEGNKRISSDELTLPLRECLSNYSEQTKSAYDRDVLDYCHRGRLMGFVRSRGYLTAQYVEPKIAVSGMSVNVTIPIDEGRVYRLGEIKIEGAAAFPPIELAALCPVKRGEILNGEKIANWLFEDIRDAYADKGFIQYMADIQPTFKSDPENKEEGTADIKVTIEEGRRFKVGSITFSGDPLSQNEMNSLFLLRAGDIYNHQLFEESVARLNKVGMFEPVDKDKDSVFQTNDEEASVAIVLTLHRKSKLP